MKNYLLVLILLATVSVQAQETEDLMQMSLDDLLNMKVEVSSSKAVNIFKSPSTVSVIDKQMIKDYNFRTVGEAISNLANVVVGRSYLKNNIPSIRGVLQDIYANKILLLINGIPLWNTVNGNLDIDRIGIDEVERIEVLKGPASVLYGTNAYAGAINIVLLKPESNKISLHGGLGDFGALEAGGNITAKSGDLGMLFSFNASHSDGAKMRLPLETVNSGVRDTVNVYDFYSTRNFTANLNYLGHNLFATAYSNDEMNMGTFITLATGAGDMINTKGYAVSYSYNTELFTGFDLKYRATYDWSDKNSNSTFSRQGNGDSLWWDTEGYRLLNELSAYYNINDQLSWEIKFDHDYLKVDYSRTSSIRYGNITSRLVNENDNFEYSASTQINYTPIDELTLNIGTRYTNNHVAGDNISSRATAVFSIDEKNSLKFNFGQSFKAPTMYELYFTSYGSVNLKPETSNSFELMYITSFDNFIVQLNGFYSTYENKIYRGYTDSTNTVIKYLNGNKFTAKGVEAEIRYTNAKLINGFVSYSYTDGDDGDIYRDSYNYLYVPQHQAAFGLSKSFDRLTLSASGIIYSEMHGFKAPIDGQFVLNFNIGYSHKMGTYNLRHVLSIKNFTDVETFYPEYSRKNVNEIPWMPPRVISYTLFIEM